MATQYVKLILLYAYKKESILTVLLISNTLCWEILIVSL